MKRSDVRRLTETIHVKRGIGVRERAPDAQSHSRAIACSAGGPRRILSGATRAAPLSVSGGRNCSDEAVALHQSLSQPMLEVAVTHSGVTRLPADAAPRLIVPVELRTGDRVLRFFSTVTTFGIAFDITLEELCIEALHQADAETEALVRSGAWLAIGTR